MFNKRMKNFLLPMFMIVFLFMGSSIAQVEDAVPQDNAVYTQNADRWTQSLNNRLTLTDDQHTRINSILIDYQTRKSQLGVTGDAATLQNDVNRQIEGVLDDSQRTNWDTYSATWWNEINMGNNMQFERRNQDMEQRNETQTDQNRDMETDKEDTEIRTDDDDIK